MPTEHARRIDANRMQELIVDAVLRWLNAGWKDITKYNVHLRNIFNMDKFGFAISKPQGACVVIDARIRSQFQEKGEENHDDERVARDGSNS